MKLNFRSVDGGGTLAHGITPIIIPPPTGGALSLRSPQTAGQGGLSETDLSLNGDHQAGYVPVRTSSRRCHVSFGTWILYLLGIVVILSLPFALPIAVSHAVRIVDRPQQVMSVEPGLKPDTQEAYSEVSFGTEKGSTFGIPESKSLTSTREQRSEDPLLPLVKEARAAPASFSSAAPVSVSSIETAPNQIVTGSSDYNSLHADDVSNVRVRTKNEHASFPNRETSRNPKKRPLSKLNRLEPVFDEWSKYVVVRHGNLYMSETFEARLNEQVAGKLFERHPEMFGHVQKDCGGKPDISFSFKASPRIQAELEIVTQCGSSEGSSCVLRPRVDDLRRLHVNVGSGKEGEHFLRADATQESQSVTWGPLVGPLKVTLLEDSIMALKKTCLDPAATATRILSVGQVKEMLREIARLEWTLSARGDSQLQDSRFDVFKYDAHPHHHIRQKNNRGYLENRGFRQEKELTSTEKENMRWNKRAIKETTGNSDEMQKSNQTQRMEGVPGPRRDWKMTRVESPRGR